MALQHLRSSTADKRPTPAAMSDGQLALNTNLASPGLFFKDSNGDSVKIGPVHVGTTAPNVSPAVGGEAGNSKGEQWLDTTGGVYVFKIYDGTAWRSETGTFVDVNGDTMTGALGIIAGSAASPGLFFSGDTNSGLYSPGADQVAVATNGTGRLFVDANGNVLINDSASVTSNVTGYVRIRQANAASDTSIAIINAQNSDANATVKIQAGQFTRRGGEIVFGRENGGDLTTTTLADGYIAFSPVLNNTNTEAVRITSAGLVGIGTSSPNATLDIESSSGTAVKIRLASNTSNRALVFSNAAETIGWTVGNGVIASARQFVVYDNEAGAARLLIDSSGNVGIGTTSPGHDIDLRKDAAGSTVTLRVRNDNVAADSNSALVLDTPNGVWGVRALRSGGRLAVDIGGSEKAAIDTSGRLLVGTSAVLTGGFVSIQFDGSVANGITLKTTYASNGSNYLAFTGSGGALAGYIQQTGSTTVSYTTTSDYRLKENVALIGDSITRLQQLKPSRFNFISEPDRIVDGFLAHEAQAVVPECVTGEKDEVDDDGTPVYQGIDQSKLVPLLTAALQEAIAKIETLEQRLTAAGID
jgi:hypothetical protein